MGPIKNGEIIFAIPECIRYTAAGALKDERIGPFIDAHTAPSKPKCDADGDDDGGEKGKVKGKVGEAASARQPAPRGRGSRHEGDLRRAAHAIHDPVQHVGAVPLAPGPRRFRRSPDVGGTTRPERSCSRGRTSSS